MTLNEWFYLETNKQKICESYIDKPWVVCESEELPRNKFKNNSIGNYRFFAANASLPQRIEFEELVKTQK